MKLRKEPEGIHFYDRISGTHVLVDEIMLPTSEYSLAPRTVSIAITDACDLYCPHCHILKGNNYLDKDIILSICKQLDKMGTFDIAIGGGEPTLHPYFLDICKSIWNETSLGLSVTTHGRNLTEKIVNQLSGNISFLRISIDGTWETYRKYRNSDYADILNVLSIVKNIIPFGINVVINSDTINDLDEILDLSIRYNAIELLLLPQINDKKFILDEQLWHILNEWILLNNDKIPLRLLSQAKQFLNVPFLFENNGYENNYAYISTDLYLKNDSYTNSGIKINDDLNIHSIIENWHTENILTMRSTRPASTCNFSM